MKTLEKLRNESEWGQDPKGDAYANDQKWNENQLRRALIILLDQVTQGSGHFGCSTPLGVAVDNAFAVLGGDESILPDTIEILFENDQDDSQPIGG